MLLAGAAGALRQKRFLAKVTHSRANFYTKSNSFFVTSACSYHVLASPDSFGEAPEDASPKLTCSIFPAQDRPNEPTAVGEVSFLLKMPHLYSAPGSERGWESTSAVVFTSSLCFKLSRGSQQKRLCMVHVFAFARFPQTFLHTLCYPVNFEPDV